MSARDELIDYFTSLLRGAFLLDSEKQARAGARTLVNRLAYVIDEYEDIETTSPGATEREVIRHKWIVVKVPSGVERHRLPFGEPAEQPKGSDRG